MNLFANKIYDPATEDPNSNEAQGKHATSVLGALGKVGRLLMDLGVTNTTGISPTGKNWQRGDQMPADPSGGPTSVGSPQIQNDPAAGPAQMPEPQVFPKSFISQGPAGAPQQPQTQTATPQAPQAMGQAGTFSTNDARGGQFSTSVAPGVVQDDSFKRAMQSHVQGGTQGPVGQQGGIPTGPQAPQADVGGTTSGVGMAQLGSQMALAGMDNPLGRFGIQQAMNDEMMGKQNWMRQQNIGAAGGMIQNAQNMAKMASMPMERENDAIKGMVDELQWTTDPNRRQALTQALDEARKRLTGYGITPPAPSAPSVPATAPTAAKPGLARAAIEGAAPGVAGGLAWGATQGLRAMPNPLAKVAGYTLPALAGWGTDKAIQSLDPQAEAARSAHPIVAAGSAALGSMLGLRGKGATKASAPATPSGPQTSTGSAGAAAVVGGKPPVKPKAPLGRVPVPVNAKPIGPTPATVQSITPQAEQNQIKQAAQGFASAGTNMVSRVKAVNEAGKKVVAKAKTPKSKEGKK